MATLQKIRNRGGLLVSIVIGLALIAFIVGDALSSGASVFNSKRNQVGEIAGDEISIREYQNRLMTNEELVKMMNNTSSLTAEQQEMLRENTWQQMVMERIMGRELAELGITVSTEELYDMLLGENMDPNVRRLFADPNTGEVDLNQARNVIKQLIAAPASSPQKSYWLNMEKEISDAREMSKYNNLLGKAMFVTDAQIEENANGNAQVSDISYIVRNYSTISDSVVQVSNKEIEQYYDENKKRFEQSESRQLVYVNFDIAPSVDDYTETEKQVADLKEEFATTQDIAEFVELTSDSKFNPAYLSKNEIENDTLAAFVFANNNVYGPYLEDGSYKIARRASVKMLPDSVRARHILLPIDANVDSLVTLLKKGTDFEELAKTNSTDRNSAINGGDLGWFSQNMMVQPFSDTAFFAKKNEIKVVTTQFGTHIVQVTDRSKPVEKVQIATITKEIYPSTATTNNIYNQARNFAHELSTMEQFNNKTAEMNLTKRMATIGKNDKGIAGIDDSRELVRQVFLTENVGDLVLTNDKSIIFESGNKFTIAALTNISEEGIAPLKQVAAQIKTILIRKKKAEVLAKEFEEAAQGSQSLLSIAQKMKCDVREATDISFNSFQVPGAGIEPNLVGSINALQQGEISNPIDGNQGVYLIQVNSRRNEEITPEMLQNVRERLIQLNAYSAGYQAIQALNKNGEIIDTRYKFY